MASSNDIQPEKPLIIETPTSENTKVKRGGRYAYAEGLHSHAEGMAAHAEGLLTHAKGSFSHAEGSNSKATGHSSHSEGSETTAGGAYSHAEGKQTIALGEADTQKETQLSLTDPLLMRKVIIHQQLILQVAILWGASALQKKLILGLLQMV